MPVMHVMKAWKGCAFLALVLLAGCSQPGEDLAGAPIGGERAKAGAFLAYEHQVGISLDPAQIEQRLAAVREACQDERFGACDLLGIEQNAGGYRSASLSLRIVPDGVDKLLALAVEGGSLESRRTQAEDLAQAVSDTQQQRQRLERQHQTLLAFQERKDLSVSDMLALARELAEVEVQLAASQQDAAQQQRRLDTNLLILDFSSAPPGRLSRLGQAFDNLADNIAEGAGQALEMLGYGLPFLVILFPLALLLHWLWRRITRTAIRHKP